MAGSASHVGHAHDDLVHPAADVAGQDPHRGPDGARRASPSGRRSARRARRRSGGSGCRGPGSRCRAAPVALPPSIQNGGSNTFAPCTGSVGSYGAMRSAKSATSMRPPRITTATSGASRTALTLARPPALERSAAMVAIVARLPVRLSREPDARVDEGVQDVHDQVDADDHEAGHDHDALHQREVALEDPLVEQSGRCPATRRSPR